MVHVYHVYISGAVEEHLLPETFGALMADTENARHLRELLAETQHIPRPIAAYGHHVSRRGRHLFLACDEDKTLVAMAECVPVLWPDPDIRSFGWLHGLVVLLRYRGRGFGRGLLLEIMRRGKSDSEQFAYPRFTKLQAVVSPGHDFAKRFLVGCGWTLVSGTSDLYQYEL